MKDIANGCVQEEVLPDSPLDNMLRKAQLPATVGSAATTATAGRWQNQLTAACCHLSYVQLQTQLTKDIYDNKSTTG